MKGFRVWTWGVVAGMLVGAQAQAVEQTRLSVRVNKNKSKATTSSTGKQESYEYEVTIRNDHPSKTYEGYTVDLYVLGVDNADRRLFKKLVSASSVFSVKPREEHTFKSEFFKIKYYNSRTTQSGTKLGGHLLIIRDAEDKVIVTEATKSSFAREANMEKIITAGKKEFRL